MTDRLISIVLPVYNQADHIGGIVAEYEAVLERVPNPHELILAVNGSRDRSLEVCQELATRYPNVRVVHSVPGGWGLGVKLGLAAAQGDLVGYTNSARTSAQDLLLFTLYTVANNTNNQVVIKANRKIRDNWQRRVGSLLYNIEVRTLFDLAQWDINGTPKFWPRAFGRLFEMQSDNDIIDAEFNAICRREGYPMLEVPVFSTQRHGGKSTTNYNSAFNMYSGAYQLYQRMKRGMPKDDRG